MVSDAVEGGQRQKCTSKQKNSSLSITVCVVRRHPALTIVALTLTVVPFSSQNVSLILIEAVAAVLSSL
jgi:hypothetical protein